MITEILSIDKPNVIAWTCMEMTCSHKLLYPLILYRSCNSTVQQDLVIIVHFIPPTYKDHATLISWMPAPTHIYNKIRKHKQPLRQNLDPKMPKAEFWSLAVVKRPLGIYIRII